MVAVWTVNSELVQNSWEKRGQLPLEDHHPKEMHSIAITTLMAEFVDPSGEEMRSPNTHPSRHRPTS